MSTLDVLQRAAAQGKNIIITHEPTFYTQGRTRLRLARRKLIILGHAVSEEGGMMKCAA